MVKVQFLPFLIKYNPFTQANGIFEDGDMPLSLYSTDTELGIKEYWVEYAFISISLVDILFAEQKFILYN